MGYRRISRETLIFSEKVLFQCSFYHDAGKGFVISVSPGEQRHGGICTMPFDGESICYRTEEALKCPRFNQKKADAIGATLLKPLRREAIAAIVRKNPDRVSSTNIDFSSEAMVRIFDSINLESPKMMGFAPEQQAAIKAQLLYEMILDKAFNLPLEEGWLGGEYILAAVEGFDDARMKLVEWGCTLPEGSLPTKLPHDTVIDGLKVVAGLTKGHPKYAEGLAKATPALMAVRL